MEDHQKQTEVVQTEVARSGADWEVVSLTSSAYAAAPDKSETSKVDSNQESALLESGQFVFPPNEHENLPIDPKTDQIEIKKQEQENSPDKEREEERGEQEENKGEGELEIAHEDQSIKKEETQEFSTEIDNREEGIKSGSEEKGEEGEEREDGLEWVKKRGLWLFQHVKEANAVWSVVVATALVGLVIIGQRWQHEKLQHQHQH